MSWSNKIAKEWLAENKINILINGKHYSAAISREPDFDSVDLIIEHHLKPHDIIDLFSKKWKVSHNTGLGAFSNPQDICLRVYAIKPVVELSKGDKFYFKDINPKIIYTVKDINEDDNYISVLEDKELLISTFYPEDIIKV